jgi:hypothetical protein
MLKTILKRLLSILAISILLAGVGLIAWFLLRSRGFELYKLFYLAGCPPLFWIVVGFSGSFKGRSDFSFLYGNSSGSDDPNRKILEEGPFTRQPLFSPVSGVSGGVIVMIIAAVIDTLSRQ